jgi:pyocin large subunit-like protein
MYLVANIADTVTYARADYINAHGGNARPELTPRPQTDQAREEQERSRQVHDALTDMLHGHLTIEAAPGDGRVYEPAVDEVR